MDRDELRELWGRNQDRPAWVREHRDELHEHLNVDEQIPNGPLYQVRDWLERHKGTVTRQLGEMEESDD